MLCEIWVNIRASVLDLLGQVNEPAVADRDLGDRDRLSGKHRLVDDRVSRQEDRVAGEHAERRIRSVKHIAGNERRRVDDLPCRMESQMACQRRVWVATQKGSVED